MLPTSEVADYILQSGKRTSLARRSLDEGGQRRFTVHGAPLIRHRQHSPGGSMAIPGDMGQHASCPHCDAERTLMRLCVALAVAASGASVVVSAITAALLVTAR